MRLNFRNHIFILILILSTGVIATAQYPQVFFTHRNVRDGLSANLCEQILRDKKGYAWVATANGVSRYDGYHFENFRNIPGDKTSLRYNEVFAIHVDAADHFWVGQDGHVSMLNPDGKTFVHFDHEEDNGKSYSGGRAADFFTDHAGRLWIATVGGGLNLFEPSDSSFSHYYPVPSETGSARNGVSDVTEDADGKLWLGTFEGLCSMDPVTKASEFFIYEPANVSHFSYHNLVLEVYCDEFDKDLVWYGTWGGGLQCLHRSTGAIDSYIYNQTGAINVTNIVYDIHPRDESTLWLATEQGLSIFDTHTKQFFCYTHEADNPHSLAGTEVRDIFIDDQHTMWLSTNDGINIASPAMQNFSVNTLAGRSAQLINDIAHHKMYGVSFYDDRSLMIYNEDKQLLSTFPIPEADLKRSEPFGFFQDRRGMIWIGCVRTGIYLFDPAASTFTKLDTRSLHRSDLQLDIRSFSEDDDGNIWMASYGSGMIKYDPAKKEFIRFGYDIDGIHHLPFQGCYSVQIDPDKNVWGSFESGGICILDKSLTATRSFDFKLSPYEPMQSMSDAKLDTRSRLWVSTTLNGLVMFDPSEIPEKQISVFNTSTGYSFSSLGSLVLDDHQNLWIAGNDGLIFFNVENGCVRNYTEEHGLYPYFATVSMQNAGNGEIWFTLSDGYCSFNPDRFVSENAFSTLVLTSFKVFDKELFPGKNPDAVPAIDLQHGQNFISFEFAALSFIDPLTVRYAYMLEGLDSSWHYCENRRYASYTELKPGNYVLKIKAAGSDGIWLAEKIIPLNIRPAWWQTSWFRIIVMVCILGMVFYGFRFFARRKLNKLKRELEKQKAIHDIRNRMARDIHDEIGSGLTKISLMSSQLSTGDNSGLPDKIQKTSRDVIDSLGEIVWTVNPGNDSLGNLTSYLRQYAGKYFDATTIDHTMDITWHAEAQKQIDINPELKRNVVMIFKEALNNIVKHSDASVCRISIEVGPAKMQIAVDDNGKGLQKKGNSTGNGLRNMEKRAEEVGGSFNGMRSELGGFRIFLSFPFQ